MNTDVQFAIVDTETIGPFPERNDRIVEIGIIRGDDRGQYVARYETARSRDLTADQVLTRQPSDCLSLA